MNSENQSPTAQTNHLQPPMDNAQVSDRPIAVNTANPVDTETPSTHYPPEAKSEGSNSAVSRALIGGLIGASLGLLAGQKISQGLNRASRGVGKGLGTIGQGLGTTAKGLGEVAQGVGDGVSYAVVGGTSEVAQNVAGGVQRVASTTANAIQQAGEVVSQGAQQAASNTANAVQQTGEVVSQVMNDARSAQASTEAEQSVIDRGTPAKSFEMDLDETRRSGFKNQSTEQPYSYPNEVENPDAVMNFYESTERTE